MAARTLRLILILSRNFAAVHGGGTPDQKARTCPDIRLSHFCILRKLTVNRRHRRKKYNVGTHISNREKVQKNQRDDTLIKTKNGGKSPGLCCRKMSTPSPCQESVLALFCHDYQASHDWDVFFCVCVLLFGIRFFLSLLLKMNQPMFFLPLLAVTRSAIACRLADSCVRYVARRGRQAAYVSPPRVAFLFTVTLPHRKHQLVGFIDRPVLFSECSKYLSRTIDLPKAFATTRPLQPKLNLPFCLQMNINEPH